MSGRIFDILDTPVEHGRTLIEASAGTGKTYAIAGLVLRFVLENWVDEVRNLLVVTFTVAATEELKSRIRTAVRSAYLVFTGQPGAERSLEPLLERFLERYGATQADRTLAARRLWDALQQLDEMPISTIHGFCKRVLETSAFESGTPFAWDFVDDASDFLSRAAADFWHRHAYDDPWLAAVAVDLSDHGGADALLAHFKEATRYSGTEVLPAVNSLPAALQRLREVADQLALSWDVDEIDTLLDSIQWYAGAPLREEADRRRVVRQVASLAGGPSPAALTALPLCSLPELEKRAQKASQQRVRDVMTSHPGIQTCTAIVDILDETRIALIHAFTEEVRDNFGREKRKAGVLTFDDLLQRLHSALEPTSAAREGLLRAIRRDYQAALIDEFQDTDPYQYGIFRRAFGEEHRLLFIGDPKQSVYSFRGADIFAYLKAKREAAREHSLGTNWRSVKGLVDAVNALFRTPARPFVYDGIPYEKVEHAGKAEAAPLEGDEKPPLVWWYVEPEQGSSGLKPAAKGRIEPVIPHAVVAEIQHLLRATQIGGQSLQRSNIAVLVRTNDQVVDIQNALRNAGIPAVASKAGNIWESLEVAELERVLRAISQPSDVRAIRTALATDLWGYSADRIRGLQEAATAWTDLLDRVQGWGRTWRRYGVMQVIARFLEEEKVSERLLGYVDGERRITNLRHAAELLHQAEQDGRQTPEELLRWLRARDVRQLTDQEVAELRLESDATAVQITTVHSSKGLEYDVVFAPYLWSGRDPNKKENPVVHPDPNEPDRVVYDLGSEDLEHHRRIHAAEQLAEELRLAYVALTRARHRCYVIWGPINQGEYSALGYLLHGHSAAPLAPPEEHAAAAAEQANRTLLDAETVLRELVASHPRIMGVEPLPAAASDTLGADAGEALPNALSARVLSSDARIRLKPWEIGSFTRWTSSATDVSEPSRFIDPPDRLPSGMYGFAAGTHAGQCLHDILEFADLGEPTSERTRALVQRTLQKYALEDPDRHRGTSSPEDAVVRLLKQLASTPLPGVEFNLGSIRPASRANEWRFTLPLGTAHPARLADAFAACSAEPLRSAYPSLLRTLSYDAMEGFLTGIVDVVFEQAGRYYIVDWKSNLLGYDPSDYSPEQLQHPMQHHHYVLQYHLYVLGLHRYLRTRIRDYAYKRNFGGVWYVFLRGVDEAGSGFYFDRPPGALIEEIESQLMPSVYA